MLEQVGVKAPGNATTITFLPEKISDDVISCQRNRFSPPILSSRTRVLNTTFGTFNTAAIAISFFMIKTDRYINGMGTNKPFSTHHLLQKSHHKVRIIISKFNNFDIFNRFYL